MAITHLIEEGDATIIFEANGDMRICAKNDKHVGSSGFWNGDNPLHFVLPITMLQILLFIIASQLIYLLLRPLRTPKFICSILGGIMLGPSAFGKNAHKVMHTLYPPRQAEFLSTLATIAACYFMFIVALKMDILTSLRAARSTWRFGFIPFFASLASVSGLVYVSKGSPLTASHNVPAGRTYFSSVLSFTNFIVVYECLMELNLASSELGKIALSSAMLNDTMQWLTLLFTGMLRNEEFIHSFWFLVYYWLLIFFSIFLVRPVMLMVVRNTPAGKPVKEVYIVLILAGVLAMAGLANVVGLSFLQGPLLFGLIMPNGPPLGTTLIDKTQSIISGFLMPLFFVYIGTNTNIYELTNWGAIMKLVVIVLVGCAAKLLACVLVAVSYRMRVRHGVVLGLMLNVKGMVELLAFTRMKQLLIVGEQSYSSLVLSVILITSIISPLIQFLYKPFARLDTSTKHRGKTITIQDTPQNAELSIIFCVFNDANVHSSVALLQAFNPNQQTPICAHVVHLCELLGKSTPFLLPMDSNKHRRKSLSKNYPNTHHIMRAFENYAHNSDGRVVVRPYLNVAPYKQMHEAICNLAGEKSIPFMIVPFNEHGRNYVSTCTTNFQHYAPCTVGILVDRHPDVCVIKSGARFHVGIFFMGGPDDREALSLGIRMTEDRQSTKVSLFWFQMSNKKKNSAEDEENKVGSIFEDDVEEEEEEDGDDEVEKILDESFMDEFKTKNIGNENVVCEEIVVEDAVGVLEAIRGLERDYDLVMVGRRHKMANVDDKEMSNFMENMEVLGMLGDMLASTEFCDGMVPVLVTQCGGIRYGNLFNKSASAYNSKKSSGL